MMTTTGIDATATINGIKAAAFDNIYREFIRLANIDPMYGERLSSVIENVASLCTRTSEACNRLSRENTLKEGDSQ